MKKTSASLLKKIYIYKNSTESETNYHIHNQEGQEKKREIAIETWPSTKTATGVPKIKPKH